MHVLRVTSSMYELCTAAGLSKKRLRYEGSFGLSWVYVGFLFLGFLGFSFGARGLFGADWPRVGSRSVAAEANDEIPIS